MYPINLGIPWLTLHNPHISWNNCKITELSVYCLDHCLTKLDFMLVTIVESPKNRVKVDIPKEYKEFTELFSITKSMGLLPYCTYD